MIRVVAGTGIVFVGRGRRDQYEDMKGILSEMGTDVRYVPGPEKLAPVLLDLRGCRKVIIFTDTVDADDARRVAARFQRVKVTDDYEL